MPRTNNIYERDQYSELLETMSTDATINTRDVQNLVNGDVRGDQTGGDKVAGDKIAGNKVSLPARLSIDLLQMNFQNIPQSTESF